MRPTLVSICCPARPTRSGNAAGQCRCRLPGVPQDPSVKTLAAVPLTVCTTRGAWASAEPSCLQRRPMAACTLPNACLRAILTPHASSVKVPAANVRHRAEPRGDAGTGSRGSCRRPGVVLCLRRREFLIVTGGERALREAGSVGIYVAPPAPVGHRSGPCRCNGKVEAATSWRGVRRGTRGRRSRPAVSPTIS